MKQKLTLLLTIIISITLPINVLAHPGRTNSSGCHICNGENTDCSKWGLTDGETHCHNKNNNTYTNSKGEVFDNSGTKISEKKTTTTKTTAKTTTTTKKIESSKTTTKAIKTTTKKKTTTQKITTTTEIKNTDTSLEYIKIDNQDISVLDNMTYETNKKDIDLNIKTFDDKAIVEFNNPELKLGKNEIIIKVTAEAGNIKEYKLIVTRIENKQDSDDDKNQSKIEVTESSETESSIINAIAYIIVAGIFLSPVIIVGTIIYLIKRKK